MQQAYQTSPEIVELGQLVPGDGCGEGTHHSQNLTVQDLLLLRVDPYCAKTTLPWLYQKTTLNFVRNCSYLEAHFNIKRKKKISAANSANV